MVDIVDIDGKKKIINYSIDLDMFVRSTLNLVHHQQIKLVIHGNLYQGTNRMKTR